MTNEQLPAPDPSARIEAQGNMSANPLQDKGVPGVEIESAEDFELPEYRNEGNTDGKIGSDDPRYAKLMAKRQDSMDIMKAAAKDAEVRGTRLG